MTVIISDKINSIVNKSFKKDDENNNENNNINSNESKNNDSENNDYTPNDVPAGEQRYHYKDGIIKWRDRVAYHRGGD